jgi:hypothetical protein
VVDQELEPDLAGVPGDRRNPGNVESASGQVNATDRLAVQPVLWLSGLLSALLGTCRVRVPWLH